MTYYSSSWFLSHHPHFDLVLLTHLHFLPALRCHLIHCCSDFSHSRMEKIHCHLNLLPQFLLHHLMDATIHFDYFTHLEFFVEFFLAQFLYMLRLTLRKDPLLMLHQPFFSISILQCNQGNYPCLLF